MSDQNDVAAGSRVLHFDCFSGLAGDMIVASLLDLGVPFETVEAAVSRLPLDGYRLRVEREERQSIMATRFFVDVDEGVQPHRHFADIRQMIESAGLDPRVARLAVEIFSLIAAAEGKVHGRPADEVHFHEVGAVDSIVDIVAAAAAIVHLDARVTCAPVPVGHGTIRAAHGVLPVPAPATLHILAGVPVEGTEVQAELTTPTGAAVIRAAASSFERFPAMVPEGVGFGAGARSHATRPGLLRTVIGHAIEERPSAPAGGCSVIEANIDDVTGEVAANALNTLLEKGALDVWFEPIQMKKGRPAIKLAVLCQQDDLQRIGAAVLAETTTIGLRHYPVGRLEMKRTMRTVDTRYGSIRVKLAHGPGGSANAAPEFEDCRRAAGEHGVPLKQVIAAAAGLAQELLDEPGFGDDE